MDKKTLTLAIKDIEAVDLSAVARGQPAKAHKIPLGVSLANTLVVFERAEGSSINLAGKSKGYISKSIPMEKIANICFSLENLNLFQ